MFIKKAGLVTCLGPCECFGGIGVELEKPFVGHGPDNGDQRSLGGGGGASIQMGA